MYCHCCCVLYMMQLRSFFGHSEFDLSIMDLFGGYTETFWSAYHAKLPKAAGFRERQRLYQLYHYLNQLNLFGDPAVGVTVQQLVSDVLDHMLARSEQEQSSAAEPAPAT